MAVLPPGLGMLELDTSCCGPVLAAAMRFKHLRELRIPGNAVGMSWHGHGAAAVLSKLKHLRLDYKGLAHYLDMNYQPASFLLDSMATELAAASGLSSLELAMPLVWSPVVWSPVMARACKALSALRNLECASPSLDCCMLGSCCHCLTACTGSLQPTQIAIGELV